VIKKYVLSSEPAPAPIVGPVSKLGGQPVWMDAPQWPLSRTTGKPMSFVGQFVLYPEIFGPLEAKMAYIFMYDDEPFVDGTWLPDGGENAVAIERGRSNDPRAHLVNQGEHLLVSRPRVVRQAVLVEGLGSAASALVQGGDKAVLHFQFPPLLFEPVHDEPRMRGVRVAVPAVPA